MTQNPNPSPADNFDDVEAKAALERKEASYPKKEDGSVDVDALAPDEAAVYWKDRHDASTRGFHQFKSKADQTLAEKEAELEALKKSPAPAPTKTEIDAAAANAETLEQFEQSIPNFDILDPDTQANLRGIFRGVDAKIRGALSNDPGVAFARQTYNENKWETAFNSILPQFGEPLAKAKADFKSKYFQPNNVPDNITELLITFAKSYLFDHAKEAGAQEERDKAARIDPLRGNGGPKEPTSGMTIDDWEHLRTTNPKAFAARSAEYNAQVEAGQLTE